MNLIRRLNLRRLSLITANSARVRHQLSQRTPRIEVFGTRECDSAIVNTWDIGKATSEIPNNSCSRLILEPPSPLRKVLKLLDSLRCELLSAAYLIPQPCRKANFIGVGRFLAWVSSIVV